MLLGLNVYHTCEALEKVTDCYTLNYSSNHQKQKEETMENNQKTENQTKNKVTQANCDQKSCHYIE
jgi:DNA-directed RNA polymerase subunit M/transcription elongation factor TFIIS